MANDTATTRLLYAILSQKCLKDIDWTKVAHDPILSQEITNGHAARMRYSRFKKQMDGTATIRRPRNSTPPVSSPKQKVEKNTKSPRKVKERKPSDAKKKVKFETSESGNGTAGGTLEATEDANVKREYVSGSEESLYLANTPVMSECSTPSPGFAATQNMDGMVSTFGMPCPEHPIHENLGHTHLFPGVMEDPHQSYGMGLQMPMGLTDPFETMWHQDQVNSEANVLVKTEERWEDTYRQA